MIEYKPANANLSFDINTLEYPLSVYLKITDRCQLSCSFCSQKCNLNGDMDLVFAKNTLKTLKKLGIMYVFYTGGEPLLHPYLLDVLKFGHELGLKQTLVTNALLLNKKTNLLNVLNYIFAIGVSLHGCAKTHDVLSGKKGTYDRVIESLRIIKKNKPTLNININCTLAEINANKYDISYLADYCKSNRFSLSVARLNYMGRGIEYKTDLKKLNETISIIDELNKSDYKIKLGNCIVPCVLDSHLRYLTHACAAGFGTAAIEVNGDVKICPSDKHVLGNLYKTSFKRIWNKRKLKAFRSMKWLPASCVICKDLLSCRGGCHAETQGKFWEETCDSLVEAKTQQVWSSIRNKYMSFSASCIRKDYNKYTIITFPARSVNKKVVNIIRMLDGSRTCEQILSYYKNDQKIKSLLIAMQCDNLLIEKRDINEKHAD